MADFFGKNARGWRERKLNEHPWCDVGRYFSVMSVMIMRAEGQIRAEITASRA
jgi:hypothetical protein